MCTPAAGSVEASERASCNPQSVARGGAYISLPLGWSAGRNPAIRADGGPPAVSSTGMATVPRRDWTMPSARRVRALRDRLRLVYGRPLAPPHRRPLDELILTVLSQSTSDRNRDVAFLRLRERFPDWAAVREAPREEVEAAIRPGGLSQVKSGRIQAILRELGDPPSLDHLAGLRSPPPAPSCAPSRGWVARRRPACFSSRSGCATCPWTPTSPAWAPGSACSARGPRSWSCTTTCSRSARAGRSSSCTSTCSATAAARATRSAPAARSARCAAPARGRAGGQA